jgi:prepilin signal peptidase PulO-like enzyme (type II secretory pathway)
MPEAGLHEQTWFLAFVVGIFGLCFGSFVTAASWRLPREEDIVSKPSYCPVCNTMLDWKDLFPLFSWLLQGGRCRHCQANIHWRYPVIEVVTAGLFLWIFFLHGLDVESIIFMLLAVCLMILMVTDFEHYMIPDEIQIGVLVLGLFHAYRVEAPWLDVLAGIAGGFGMGLLLLLSHRYIRKREGLGFGDVKFMGAAGAWLGLLNLAPFLFFAGIAGTFIALMWRALGLGKVFPFGPGLAISLFGMVMFEEFNAFFWWFTAHIFSILRF